MTMLPVISLSVLCILGTSIAQEPFRNPINFPNLGAPPQNVTPPATAEVRGVPEFRLSAEPSQPKLFVVKERPDCLSSGGVTGLCAADEEYDVEIERRFIAALKNSNLVGDLGTLFSELLLDDVNVIDELPPGIRTRTGGGDLISEDPVCPAREKIIYPKRGQTKNEDWVFLFNQGEAGGFQQGIKVEECHNANTECTIGRQAGIDSVCRQKYIYRKMLAMDQTGTLVSPESILVPSCCVCYTQSILPRFGRNGIIGLLPKPPPPGVPLSFFPDTVSDATPNAGTNDVGISEDGGENGSIILEIPLDTNRARFPTLN